MTRDDQTNACTCDRTSACAPGENDCACGPTCGCGETCACSPAFGATASCDCGCAG